MSVGSVNGLQDYGNHAYSAAKAGLGSLTRTLAGHAGPRGVRVNLVAPGTVRTPPGRAETPPWMPSAASTRSGGSASRRTSRRP